MLFFLQLTLFSPIKTFYSKYQFVKKNFVCNFANCKAAYNKRCFVQSTKLEDKQ
ncbi:hypothetical protein TPE_1009 [Treponema pedis str. T A4]|uniref:Uncharacterized protein n=1 Tax=Treponema pedis str. T A4 TaxID=1291379 RepID=S5ZTP0_9SPIR|nr:hypothetical protein TPE_1009 [Treponema pedis str. T A4]